MKPGMLLLMESNPDDEALTHLAFEARKNAIPVLVDHDGAEALEHPIAQNRSAGRWSDALPILMPIELSLPKVCRIDMLLHLADLTNPIDSGGGGVGLILPASRG